MTDETSPLTIGMLAGEASGDNLGAPLIRAMKARRPGSRFLGIGGPAMIAQGFESFHDIDRLSVNGFVEPAKRLPELLRIYFDIRRRLIDRSIDCFIGVDFNFFNGLLEATFKRAGITTVHYVSPTVWAWRPGRLRKIARDVDLMLALYPFETTIYESHGIPVRFVGHPKAHEIEPGQGVAGKAAARSELGLGEADTVLAILPGSRSSEVALSGPDFFRAAAHLHRDRPMRFVIPAAGERRRQQIEALWQSLNPEIPVNVTSGGALVAMTAADIVLVNSGTATLEAMLLGRPMVMSYRLGKLTYALVSRMVSTQYFALPNILLGRPVVPELLQDAATPEALAGAIVKVLDEDHSELLAAFEAVHLTLRRDAGSEAADAVIRLCEEHSVPM
ncbi:MAG: lipid-A-disaccharide synthase [Proteobacteria bacterium]|nr:lipid-A-disaccharide synthase [Pseudomonadota bacterium]